MFDRRAPSPTPMPFFGGGPNGAPDRRSIVPPGEPTPMPFFGPAPIKRDLGGEPTPMPFFGGPYGKPIARKRPMEPVPMPFFSPGGQHNTRRPRGGNPWLEMFIRSLYGV